MTPPGSGARPARRPSARAVFPALGLLAALAAWPWPLPAALRAGAEARIAAALGAPARLSGEAVLALLPYPRLTFEGLSVGPEDAPALTAASLRAAPRLGALLRGRLVIDDVLLVEPVLFVGPALRLAAPGAPAGPGLAGLTGAALRDPAAALRAVAAAPAALGLDRLRVLRGSAIDAGGARAVAGATGALRRARGGGAALAGALRWRGATVELAAAAPPPAGGAAEVAVRSPLGSLAFVGSASGDALAGRLRLASPDAAALTRWVGGGVGAPAALDGGAEGVEVTGRLTAGRGRHGLDEAVVLVASERYEGAAGLALDGPRPVLGATLAAARSDLGARLASLLGPLPPVTDPSGAWSRAPLPAPAGPLDLDLRLSAGALALGPLALEDAALTLSLREGGAELVLSDALWRGGRAKGRLALAPAGDALEARGGFGVERAALERWAPPGAPSLALTGALSAQGAFEARGDSIAALAGGLDGRGALALRPLLLEGADLERLLLRDGAGEAARGRTALGAGRLSLRLRGGAAEALEGASEAPGPRVVIAGRGDLPSRSLSALAEVVGGAPERRLAYDLTLAWGAGGPRWSAGRSAP